MTRKTDLDPTIATYSGEYFDFTDPHGSIFSIEDIAKGLSNTARFGGQGENFYSVAEHSVHTSYLVPKEDAYDALMHDAAEAFIGDIPTPLKRLLPEFKAIEQNVENAIFTDFEVSIPMVPSVKQADMEMLLVEQRQVMQNHDNWKVLEGVNLRDLIIQFWDPHTAMDAFLDRFYELSYIRRLQGG